MCGHGMIGLVVTLAHLGRIGHGRHRIETPVGVIEAELLAANEVSIRNVPSYRYRAAVSVDVAGLGRITGDIAWGGNWFFLTDGSPYPLSISQINPLSEAAAAIKHALQQSGITGEGSAEVDHIIFYGAPVSPQADSRNFVYCPGGAYDRSPCGTATSAKLACLAAEGKLPPGREWIQESIIGSTFRASYCRAEQHRIIPSICGHAYICAEGQLIRQPQDPYRNGIQTLDD